MHYGHSSWIALVVFGGMVAIRYLTSQRRRGDHPQGPHSGSSFTSPGRPGPTAEPFVDARGTTGTESTGIAPGWFTDPPPQNFGRRAAG